jgi:hypothetical protein
VIATNQKDALLFATAGILPQRVSSGLTAMEEHFDDDLKHYRNAF